MDIIDYRTINLNRIDYSDPVKVKGNCLLTRASYKYNNKQIPIYIQTPKMKSINGVVMNETRSYIELEISRNDINFYDFINKIDEHNIHITFNNSEEWFEQKLPMDVIDDFYNSPIKSKMNSLPTIKFKVPIYKNKKSCEIFSENGVPTEPKLVKKNTECICILELTGIKYFKHRFECEWNVVQMKAYTNENIVRECMIKEELLSDHEDDNDYCIEEKKPRTEEENTEVLENEVPLETNETNELAEETNEVVEENNEVVEENNENVEETNELAEENNEVVEENNEVVEENNEVAEETSEAAEETNEVVEENNETEETNEAAKETNENEVVEEKNLNEVSNEEINVNELNVNNEISNAVTNAVSNETNETEEEVCLEENNSDSDEEIELDESDIEFEELRDLDNLEEVELEEPENESRNIEELMEEINHLKQSALEKDEEVNNLKNKYKNLYQELNL